MEPKNAIILKTNELLSKNISILCWVSLENNFEELYRNE